MPWRRLQAMGDELEAVRQPNESAASSNAPGLLMRTAS